MPRKKGYKVMYSHEDDEWKVKRSGNNRASRTFDRKTKAVKYGKKQAKRTKSSVRVFTRDGRHQSTQTYSNTEKAPSYKQNV